MPIAAASAGSDDDDDDDDFDDDLDVADADFGKFAWDPVAERTSPPQPPPPPPPPPKYTSRPSPRGGPASSTSRSSSTKGLQPPPPTDDLRREVRLLAAAAAAGLAAAARAVSRALDLLRSFVRRRPPARPAGSGRAVALAGAAETWGLDAVAVPPRPAEVARLMAAVVAGSLALLAVVLLCDEVGRRLITETLVTKK